MRKQTKANPKPNPLVDIDDPSQDVLVRPASTMVDGVREELSDGDSYVIDPSIQPERPVDPARSGPCRQLPRPPAE
jgi:hypothetical protein